MCTNSTSVIALSKLYSLNDLRIAQTSVKGELVVPESNIIMTRSRARASSYTPLGTDWSIKISNIISPTDPDQYTIVPATLKILKVLITELLSASGANAASNLAAAAASHMAEDDDDDDGDDEGWEDEPDTLDLSLGSTKADLMGWIENTNSRKRDDETQQYLSEFFLAAAKDNISGFQQWYNMLTEEEKAKLNELAAPQQQ